VTDRQPAPAYANQSFFNCLYPQCGSSYTTSTLLDAHYQATHSGVPYPTPCVNPNAYTQTQATNTCYSAIPFLPTTGPNFINAATNASPTPGPAEDLPRFPCEHCGETFGRIGDLQRHAKKHQSKSDWAFQCPAPMCEYRHYRKDKVNQHVGKKHRGVAPLWAVTRPFVKNWLRETLTREKSSWNLVVGVAIWCYDCNRFWEEINVFIYRLSFISFSVLYNSCRWIALPLPTLNYTPITSFLIYANKLPCHCQY